MPEPLTATTIVRGATTFTIRKLLPEAQFEVFEFHIRPNLGRIIEAVGGDVAKILKTAIPLFDQIKNRTEKMTGAELLEMIDEGSVAGVLNAVGKALSGLPPDDLMALRDRLFEQVWFTSKMSPQNQKVSGAIGTAFYQMPFTRIYELLARAAVCNFGDSWSDIASLLGMADVQDSSQPDSVT